MGYDSDVHTLGGVGVEYSVQYVEISQIVDRVTGGPSVPGIRHIVNLSFRDLFVSMLSKRRCFVVLVVKE